MLKFKKGDTIQITSGKDKGKTGKIERVFPKESRVLVLGLNLYKRHVKKRDEKNPGGILDIPRPIPFANIAVVDSQSGKPTRVGFDVKSGDKKRIAKISGNSISKS